MKLKLLLFLSFGFLFSNCNKSLVYSPSINLTSKPIKKKEIDAQVGAELLPETNQRDIEGSSNTVFGINGQVAYGFTDKFSLTAKFWADPERKIKELRSGFALSAQIVKPISPKSRLIILPRIARLLEEGLFSKSGWQSDGLCISAVYHRSLKGNYWYAGGGAGWGTAFFSKKSNFRGEEKIPMGFGLVGHLGYGWEFTNNLRLICELSPILHFNTFERNTRYVISPTIGLGYTFKKNSN